MFFDRIRKQNDRTALWVERFNEACAARDNQDVERYLSILQELAAEKYPKAMNWLAVDYMEEKYLRHDCDKAMALFREAAKLGYTVSMFNIGFYSWWGFRVEKDPEKAVSWFHKAADTHKDPEGDACYYLYIAYRDGIGTAADPVKAEEYRKKAAALNVHKLHEYYHGQRLSSDSPSLTSKEDLQKLHDTVQKGFETMQEKIETIGTKLDNLLSLTKEIAGEIAEERQKYNRCTVFTEDDETRFITCMAEKINEKFGLERTEAIVREEKQLEGLFGTYWNDLDPYTRRSLVSSKVFLNAFNHVSTGGLDFSGAVIAATSALENELKIRFFDGYKSFLSERYGTGYSQWPKAMLDDNGMPRNFFTLGTMPFIFGVRQRVKTDTEGRAVRELNTEYVLPGEALRDLEDYIRIIAREDTIKRHDFIKYNDRTNELSIVDRCEDCRCVYRNAAAHQESVPLEDAVKCLNDVIGVENAAKGIGMVQGLLYDIVRLTERPKNV